jgi:hypothetical protein
LGTRGTTGFIIDGQRKSSYQQYDSYLEGVGVEVLAFTRKLAAPAKYGIDLSSVHKLARDLKIVPESGKPTPEDLKLIGDSYHDGNVSTGSDWYSYLRLTQGNPAAILDSGYATGDDSFGHEEYDYVIDFDAEQLVVYAGGNLIATHPFANLPTNKEFIKAED